MELFGEFKFNEESTFYEFIVTRVINWKAGDEVFRITGDHIEENINENVESLTVSFLMMSRFPRGIGRFFPNLRNLSIEGCGLKSINKNDLIGLENLQQLALDGNEITTLPEDLFQETPLLEKISLSDNKIKFELIDACVLDSLKYLKLVNFIGNVNIDKLYTTEEDDQSEVYETVEHFYHSEGYWA